LIPTKSETNRVVACEVLIANDPVRNHIRTGMLHHLHTEMTLGRRIGMMTLEDSLASLVKAGLILENEGRNRSNFPDEFLSYLKP
jgi:twitching motility protein PilT